MSIEARGTCHVAPGTAFITDLFSRTIVGWQVADHLRADLALDALRSCLAVPGTRLAAGLGA